MIGSSFKSLYRNVIDKFIRSTFGVASVEMALVTPFLIVLLIGVVDFSVLLSSRSVATGSLAAGTQYFMTGGTDLDEALTIVDESWQGRNETRELNAYFECFCGDEVCECDQNCADGSAPDRYSNITASYVYDGFFISREIVINEVLRVR